MKMFCIILLSCLILSQYSSVQSFSRVRLFVTPWTTARQASLSIANSGSLLKLMSVESVMPSSHLILCLPLLLPSIFASIRWLQFATICKISLQIWCSGLQHQYLSQMSTRRFLNCNSWSHIWKRNFLLNSL